MEILTMDDFMTLREQVRTTYGDGTSGAAAKRDQELARLYVRSGWTQRALAEVEKLSLSRIGQRLCYGKFFLWAEQQILSSSARQAIDQLTCSKYDKVYWQSTKKDDEDKTRYQAIVVMLEHNATLPPAPRGSPKFAQGILQAYGDGKWHAFRVMVAHLEVAPERLEKTLDAMRLRGSHHAMCERRKASPKDGGWQYRLVPHQGHTIAYDVLKHEIAPLIEELKTQGQRNQATISPGTVTEMAYRIEKLLEKLAR